MMRLVTSIRFHRLALPVLCCTAAFALVAGSSQIALAQQPAGAAEWAALVKLPASEAPVKLFNGTDFTGWEGQIDKHWSIKDGVITGKNTDRIAASTYLFTKEKYRNFRLLFEVKQTVGPGFSTTHSAIGLLGEKFTDQGDEFSFKGPLAMFCKDWGFYEVNGRNRLAPPGHRGTLRHSAEKDGDWNQIEILVVGDRIREAANGQLVADFTDQPDKFKESPIGLQLHSNRMPQEYQFRGLILTKNPEDKLLTVAAEAPKP